MILIMKKMYLSILTQATIKCAKRQKKVMILLLSSNPNLFLDLKRYHSLEHAETKKCILLFRYLFVNEISCFYNCHFEEIWL